ncbi:MAG TPA: ATP-dependent helicase, partial [Verrucomicrobiae bacterium]|nr:ATP-dependent helicase [Verrucomicrobiae bacterium]
MPKISVRNGNGHRAGTTKYDAHHKVLSQTYGAFADLRRELSDSKETVCNRDEILRSFATCPDSQRSWLLLEDYFEKLSLSRKDFPDTNWWPKLLNAQGKNRLEELAFLFLRAKRSVPPELQPHASLDRFAKAEEAEQEIKLVQELEHWLSPPAMPLLDTPRATLRVICKAQPDDEEPSRHKLAVQFLLSRPRTGEKARPLHDLIDLVVRATHEQELFPPHDWEFIQWITDTHRNRQNGTDTLILSDAELLQWLARWGHTNRLELQGEASIPASRDERLMNSLVPPDQNSAHGVPRPTTLQFHGQIISLAPYLENSNEELSFTHRFSLPDGQNHSVADAKFFNQQPPLALVGNTFYLLRNAPPARVLKYIAHKPSVPVRKLSHRLLLHLRKTQSNGTDWEQLCVTHKAAPQFVFELLDDTVRLRLLAKSLRDQSVWFWNGHEWQRDSRGGASVPANRASTQFNKPEILDDPRL